MKRYHLAPVISSEEISSMVDGLADRLDADYQGKEVLIVGILKGAFVFLADLVRKISFPTEIDFVRLASYGKKSESSGEVKITKDVELPVSGRHVLVVEDIVDTGITLAWLLDYIRAKQPESLRVCALIDKLERREIEVQLDYVGIRLEKGFLVGYGLDYSEKHRQLPGIHEVQFDE